MHNVSNESTVWSTHTTDASAQRTGNDVSNAQPNHRLQNYAYVLEACGAVAGKRVLDVGFGDGALARSLDLMGATVSAIDINPENVPRLRVAAPTIAWWKADMTSWERSRNADPFDLIIACDCLQFVDFDDALRQLLGVLAPNGRMVGLLPNADFAPNHDASSSADALTVVSMSNAAEVLQPLAQHAHVAYRGIFFQPESTLVPLRSGPWINLSNHSGPPRPYLYAKRTEKNSRPPGQLQFVIQLAD